MRGLCVCQFIRINAAIHEWMSMMVNHHKEFDAREDTQFLAVCSSSILAEALSLSSPFASQSRQKPSVLEKRSSLSIGQLPLSTSSDKPMPTICVYATLRPQVFRHSAPLGRRTKTPHR